MTSKQPLKIFLRLTFHPIYRQLRNKNLLLFDQNPLIFFSTNIIEMVLFRLNYCFKIKPPNNTMRLNKGGLISESLSLWLKSQNKGAKSLSCVFSFLVNSAQENELAPFWRFEQKFLRLSHL